MALQELGLRKQPARVARLAVAAGTATQSMPGSSVPPGHLSESHLIPCVPIAFGFN